MGTVEDKIKKLEKKYLENIEEGIETFNKSYKSLIDYFNTNSKTIQNAILEISPLFNPKDIPFYLKAYEEIRKEFPQNVSEDTEATIIKAASNYACSTFEGLLSEILNESK